MPQFDVQLPGPGLAHGILLETLFPSTDQHFFPAAAPVTNSCGSRGGEKMRPTSDRMVSASTSEEAGLIEDLLSPQQVIDRPPELGRQDAERLGRAVLLGLPRLPALGPFAGTQVQTRRL